MAEENGGSIQRALNAGIEAVRSGDRATARRLLEAVIARDPQNELAWIWLASAVTTERERRICLEKVLEINPNNRRAQEALNSIAGIGGGDADSALRDLQRNAGNAGGGLLSNPIVIGVLIIGMFGVVALIANILVPQSAPPQPTPRPTIPRVETATPTLLPTRPIVIVDREDRTVNLPPTNTPTATFTPTEPPTPTATPFELNNFEMLYTGRAPGETTFALFRTRGDGSGETRVLDDARDVNINASATGFAFTRIVSCGSGDASAPESTAEPGQTVGAVSEVFVGNLNNPADVRQVTTLCNADAHSPVLSPDGRQVIFVSAFDQADEELWILELDSGLTRQLTDNEQMDRDPQWSPDGRSVLFTSDRESPGLSEIYVIDLQAEPLEDGSIAATRLTEDPGNSYAARWSPDGERIAYLNDGFGDGDIYIMNADGGNSRLLITSDNAEERAPDWTPDGESIAYLSNVDDTSFRIYVIDTRGRNILPVVTSAESIDAFSYRPDSRFQTGQ